MKSGHIFEQLRWEEKQVINFKEELSKYQPVLEVDQIEDAIHSGEVQDILDILQHISEDKYSSIIKQNTTTNQ